MTKEVLECSFCGKQKAETNLLIAGLGAHICDRCIEQAHGIVVEESKHQGQEITSDLMLKKLFGQLRHWSRPNKEGDGCGSIQPLQKVAAITIRRCH
jgi:hypothetical protein